MARKVSQAVICLLSALQFHVLTSQLPWQVWIAMRRGSHGPRLDHPPIKMVQFTGEAYTQGIETHERDGATLQVYLLNVAKANGTDFNLVLVRFALERLWYRLSTSAHADRFILKVFALVASTLRGPVHSCPWQSRLAWRHSAVPPPLHARWRGQIRSRKLP